MPELVSKPQILKIMAPRGFGSAVAEEARAAITAARERDKFSHKISIANDTITITDLGFRLMLEVAHTMRLPRDLFWVIRQRRAGSIGDLKAILEKIDWQTTLLPRAKVFVHSNSVRSLIYNENLMQTVANEVLSKIGMNIVAKEDADQVIRLELTNNQLEVSQSLTGQPMRFRGYKTRFVNPASMREDLAACVLDQFLVANQIDSASVATIAVPFAGSGTLGFEAAIALRQIPIFLFRPMACASFPLTPQATIENIRKNLTNKISNLPLKLWFIEIDQDQAVACRANSHGFLKIAGQAGANITSEVTQADFLNFQNTPERHPTILWLLNPPWGQRLQSSGETPIESLYRNSGMAVAAHDTHSGLCLGTSDRCLSEFRKGISKMQEVRSRRKFSIRTATFSQGGTLVSALSFTLPSGV